VNHRRWKLGIESVKAGKKGEGVAQGFHREEDLAQGRGQEARKVSCLGWEAYHGGRGEEVLWEGNMWWVWPSVSVQLRRAKRDVWVCPGGNVKKKTNKQGASTQAAEGREGEKEVSKRRVPVRRRGQQSGQNPWGETEGGSKKKRCV